MNNRERYQNGILTVRFTGPTLNAHGVSIYDLSESLLAVQRIVHKAFLSQEGRLSKGAFPNREERERLALQLGERRRSSDAFALVPMLTDPAVKHALSQLADYALSGLVGYFTGNVLDTIRGENDQNKKRFIGSIHAETVNIVNRIDAVGGVEGISIGSPALGRETVAAFNSDSKSYLKDLKNETYLGVYTTIYGKPFKLYPNSKIVGIVNGEDNSKVSVFLSEQQFNMIRYNTNPNQVYSFSGRPVYNFGIDSGTVEEFEADNVACI